MREAIVKELVGAVKKIAGNGYLVTAQKTTKNNGVKMLGIEIRKPGETVVPRLYVDGIVDRVEDGFMTVEDAAKKVFETYQNSETPEIEMNVEKLIDRKFILDHVEYQLVNAERNAESLTFSADGYVTFSVYDTGWELAKSGEGEYRLKHEIGLEEK